VEAREGLRAIVPTERSDREKPSNTKYLPVDEFFADLLGWDKQAIYTTGISKPGNMRVRATQSGRATQARLLIAVVEDAHKVNQLEGVIAKAAEFVGPGRKSAAILIGERADTAALDVLAIVEKPGGPVLPVLAAHWPNIARHDPAPRAVAGPGPTLAVPLSMDARTERMARLAIATSPAVLFVGPPGTGKNRLLNEILEEIAADPASYGFTKAREVVVEPAEEGWTTRDLVGGETIDEASGLLRFRPGRVLDAVASDRWLVIDEANRADLDRIFGGLLTWLSRQQVVVGRASTKVDAPLVRLGWADGESSYAEGTNRLAATEVGTEPIDYFAGTEFRLLGTYNALDAQRVFRFGLALGRRFAQVPIPPASVGDFAAMLETPASVIDSDEVRQLVSALVIRLYAAHHSTAGAQLGPAMFLSIPEYVDKGLALADLVGVDPGNEEDVLGLALEAYLLSTGSWLARLDEQTELPVLGGRLTTASVGDDGTAVGPALSSAQWDWLIGQLPTIGG
jgi:hypothetical protein